MNKKFESIKADKFETLNKKEMNKLSGGGYFETYHGNKGDYVWNGILVWR